MASTPFTPPAWWLSGTNQNSIPANDNALRFWISQADVDNATTAQPASPAEGQCHIIQATHTGAQWSAFTPKDLAIFSDGTWYAFAPSEGNRVSVSGVVYVFNSGDWTATGGSGGGGVVESIVAGDGISVDSSDPANPIVSSTGGGGGVTGFTSSLNTSTPNGTVNASVLLASGGTTNQDFVVSPKGAGAILAAAPDSSTSGGDKRGARAVDLQRSRTDPSQVASGADAVALGSNNTASGANSSAIGSTSVASGARAIALGYNCLAEGDDTLAQGRQASTRGITGAIARASGAFSSRGDAQTMDVFLRISTTDATPAALTADGSLTADSVNQLSLPNGSVSGFEARVVARSSGGDVKDWLIRGTVKRQSGTVSIVGTPSVTVIAADAGASAWVAAVGADTGNAALQVTVTGEVSTSIKWGASLRCAQVAG